MSIGIQTASQADYVQGPPIGDYPCASDRLALVMRVAKLVGSTGEFICVICEVSSTELKLRLLHPLPDEHRFALELPNGDFYFVEKMWERDKEAGFRFSAPIDIDAFISEASPFEKRHIRLRTALPAKMSAVDATSEVVIRDLSQEGARIEASHPVALYQRIRLDADPISSPIFASVHWKSRLHFGVLFQRAFSLAELAQIAWSLHDPANSGGGRARRFEVVRSTPR